MYLLDSNYKSNSNSFINVFNTICFNLKLDRMSVILNIDKVVKEFKDDCFYVDNDTESELISRCLNNYQDLKMIEQLNLVQLLQKVSDHLIF